MILYQNFCIKLIVLARKSMDTKKTLGDTKRFLQIKGGRWGLNGEAEARIPLKINIFLSSQPTKQHSSYKQKQSAEGAVFDGGAFGCLQTESAYNKKTQGL